MRSEGLALARLRGAFAEPRAAAARAAAAAEGFGCEVQLVRPEVLVSQRQVASAARHAERARAEGRARAQSLGLEFLCFLSGQRQIAHALERAGLAPGAREVVAVVLGTRAREALPAVARALGAEFAGEVAWQGARGLAALGASAPQGQEEARALELVALLDVER